MQRLTPAVLAEDTRSLQSGSQCVSRGSSSVVTKIERMSSISIQATAQRTLSPKNDATRSIPAYVSAASPERVSLLHVASGHKVLLLPAAFPAPDVTFFFPQSSTSKNADHRLTGVSFLCREPPSSLIRHPQLGSRPATSYDRIQCRQPRRSCTPRRSTARDGFPTLTSSIRRI